MCYDPNKNIRLISPYLGGLGGLCARSLFRPSFAPSAPSTQSFLEPIPWRPLREIIFSGTVSRQARQERKDIFLLLKLIFLGGPLRPLREISEFGLRLCRSALLAFWRELITTRLLENAATLRIDQ
jgi:hypothetical protein